MSESNAEKPFEATPSRIAKAKRDGNVARAQEFGSAIAFTAAAGAVLAVATPFATLAQSAIVEAAKGRAPIASVAGTCACAAIPALAAAIAGVSAAVLQTGGLRPIAVQPKFERLNPGEGVKRMLSREAATHAVRAALAFGIAALAVAPSIRDIFGTIAANTPASVAAVAWAGSARVVFAAAAVGGAFAFAEYAVARRAWLRKLKMSWEELKRDLKESDGDPAARGRRKTFHRNLLRGAIAKVRDASFVVVNPTHVAIALDYRPPEVPIPSVLVRAAGESALRVRQLAAQYGVPIVKDVALARALYRDAECGQAIPVAHFVAVAEVVAALIRTGAMEGRS